MSFHPTEFYPPFYEGLSGQDATQFALTDFRFGSQQYSGDFIWEFPHRGEARSGERCHATGYKAAKHAMKTVDGKRYIRDFAPRPKGSS